MATYIKSTCESCQTNVPCSGCDGCGTIQQALGLPPSASSVSIKLEVYKDDELMNVCDEVIGLDFACFAFGFSCGYVVVQSTAYGGEGCGIYVQFYDGTYCNPTYSFIPEPISLPVTTPPMFVGCDPSDLYIITITLS